ncbi:MAG: hypothetical protein AVDCRST_MAG19-452, partial [uncultured Thermomicrobiales bacterium]
WLTPPPITTSSDVRAAPSDKTSSAHGAFDPGWGGSATPTRCR